MPISHASFAALQKILYPFGPETLLYEDCVFAGMVKKSDRLVGESVAIPLKFSPGHKSSPSFGETLSNHSASRRVRFLVTDSYKHYSVVDIATEAIRRSKGNMAALRTIVQDESDSALHSIANDIGTALYGNGGGARGRISAFDTTGAGTITLVNPDDVIHFEVGMRIQPATTDGTSGAVINDITTIASIDRDAGTITLEAAPSADGNYASPNYLFKVGEFGAVAHGLDAWIPPSAPSSTLFLNVNRAQDPSRLAGGRYTATLSTDGTVLRALGNSLSRLSRNGNWARPDVALCSSRVFQAAINEAEERTTINREAINLDGKPNAKIGYAGISVVAGKSRVTLVEDPFNTSDTIYTLRMDTWEVLCVPGGWPGMLDEAGDGGKSAIPDADGVRWRWGAMYDLACTMPGANGRVDVSELMAA